jgi:hypothetical protein
MQLKGDVTIRAPGKQVWDFMTDPNQIGQCAPGVEKIEMIEPLKRYRGIVSDGSTRVHWTADTNVSGQPASLAWRPASCCRSRKNLPANSMIRFARKSRKRIQLPQPLWIRDEIRASTPL